MTDTTSFEWTEIVRNAHETGLHVGTRVDDCPLCPVITDEARKDHEFHAFGQYSFCPLCREDKERERQALDEENAADIDQYTILFAEAVDGALKQAQTARGAVEKLTGPAYDVELAEGADGDDALAALDAAMGHLRNAARIAKWRRSLMLADPRLTP